MRQLKKRSRELDFALWDRGNAYSVFRQREGGHARKMDIVFSSTGKNADVATKLELYKQIMVRAWLVDAAYADGQSDIVRELLPELRH